MKQSLEPIGALICPLHFYTLTLVKLEAAIAAMRNLGISAELTLGFGAKSCHLPSSHMNMGDEENYVIDAKNDPTFFLEMTFQCFIHM